MGLCWDIALVAIFALALPFPVDRARRRGYGCGFIVGPALPPVHCPNHGPGCRVAALWFLAYGLCARRCFGPLDQDVLLQLEVFFATWQL